MATKPLFAGLSIEAEYEREISRKRTAPKESSSSTGTTAKPSHRLPSRQLAFSANTAKQDKAMRESAWRRLDFAGFGEARTLRPLSDAEGANALPATPEHVAERKAYPLMDAKTGLPRVRRTTGTLPAGCRATATAPLTTTKNYGVKNSQIPNSTRPRSAEKVVMSRGKGMTAKRVVTREQNIRDAEKAALAHRTELTARGDEIQTAENIALSAAKRSLANAQRAERDALARGDKDAATAARADIRKFRKLTNTRGR